MTSRNAFLPVCLVAAGWLPAPAQAQGPASAPRRVIQRGSLPTGYLGVAVVEVDAESAKANGLKEERGLQVTKVDAGSPASRAGLKENDILLSFNGQKIEGLVQFVRMVAETPANRRIPLEVSRAGAPLNLTAVMGQRAALEYAFSMEASVGPEMPPAPLPPAPPEINMPDVPSGLLVWESSSLGYLSEPVDGQLAQFFGVKDGVLIRSVAKQSPAERAGLKAGDVVVKVDGVAVKTPREITAIARRRRERKGLTFSVIRARKEVTLDLVSWNRPEALTEGNGQGCANS